MAGKATHGAQAEHPPLTGASLGIVTFALALSTFMQVLDATIANVAVPTIAGNLGASSSQGTWVITSYGVANAIGIPVTGWLAMRFGAVKVFLWAVLLFAFTSLLCGMAPGLGSLVVFRVLQGAVAGPMMPLSQSLLLSCYPPARRGMAIALWGMTTSVAPICGPILGGYISDNFYWGWIFFINVPLGALAAWVCWALLRKRETATVRRKTDYVGLMLLMAGVGAFQMMLDRGKELDWFNSTEIIVLSVIAVVGITFLVAWEKTDENPIIDFSLFRSRNFTIGVICISLGMMVYLASVVLLPLLLQMQLGYTATLAGLAAAPIGFFPIVLAPLVGKNAHKGDLRFLVTVSFLVFAACFFMRTTFSPLMDFRYVIIPQFVQGIALALFFTPLTAMAFAELKPHQMAAGASLFNFFRQLCGAIGVSAATTLWERREALHHTHLTEYITPYTFRAVETMDFLQAQGMTELQSAGYLAREITRQGFVIASNEVFWLFGVLVLGLIPVVWLAKSSRR